MKPFPSRFELPGGWYFQRFAGGWFLMPPDGYQLPIGQPWPLEEIENFINRLAKNQPKKKD